MTNIRDAKDVQKFVRTKRQLHSILVTDVLGNSNLQRDPSELAEGMAEGMGFDGSRSRVSPASRRAT